MKLFSKQNILAIVAFCVAYLVVGVIFVVVILGWSVAVGETLGVIAGFFVGGGVREFVGRRENKKENNNE